MIAVRIPRTAPGHEKSPIAGALPIVWRRRRDSRVACGDLTREGASRPARARPPHTDVNAALRSWASPRSTRNAPLGRCDLAVRIPCTAPRHEKSPIAGALPIVWRRRRDSRVACGDAHGSRLRLDPQRPAGALRPCGSNPPHRPQTRKEPHRWGSPYCLAEEEGFEPSYPRRGKRFSRPPHSTTLPPLRMGDAAPRGTPRNNLAESLGFEPRIRFRRIHDFQSCSFGHSDNSP